VTFFGLCQWAESSAECGWGHLRSDGGEERAALSVGWSESKKPVTKLRAWSHRHAPGKPISVVRSGTNTRGPMGADETFRCYRSTNLRVETSLFEGAVQINSENPASIWV